MMRPSSVSVLVQDLTVDYRIHVSKKRSLHRLLTGDVREREKRRIHALKDVSFIAHEGESIGVIGHNGSGKSTLLRALGGLVPITRGAVRVRSAPVLLGVRAALEPELSARQNILLGGTSLGIPRSDLLEQTEQIVAFAGLEDFIDVPLRAFSSGMKARLQFAIATSATPDILLIDEALSVGDAEFKVRSDEKISELAEDARTVFVVSHTMRSLLDICERALWIHQGSLIADGPADEVIAQYRKHTGGRRRGARRRRSQIEDPDDD